MVEPRLGRPVTPTAVHSSREQCSQSRDLGAAVLELSDLQHHEPGVTAVCSSGGEQCRHGATLLSKTSGTCNSGNGDDSLTPAEFSRSMSAGREGSSLRSQLGTVQRPSGMDVPPCSEAHLMKPVPMLMDDKDKTSVLDADAASMLTDSHAMTPATAAAACDSKAPAGKQLNADNRRRPLEKQATQTSLAAYDDLELSQYAWPRRIALRWVCMS